MKVGEKVNGFVVLANTDEMGNLECSGKGCPTVYSMEGDDVLVQGYVARGLFGAAEIPEGEDVVRIPKGLLRQLVANDGI
jgi:hypothetical protein